MPDWFNLIIMDLKNSWLAIDFSSFALLSFLFLWLLIPLCPLIGIDRRDPVAGFVYVLYCIASGVALVIVIPENLTTKMPFKTQFNLFLGMAIFSAFRWKYHNKSEKDGLAQYRQEK